MHTCTHIQSTFKNRCTHILCGSSYFFLTSRTLHMDALSQYRARIRFFGKTPSGCAVPAALSAEHLLGGDLNTRPSDSSAPPISCPCRAARCPCSLHFSGFLSLFPFLSTPQSFLAVPCKALLFLVNKCFGN